MLLLGEVTQMTHPALSLPLPASPECLETKQGSGLHDFGLWLNDMLDRPIEAQRLLV